MNKVIKIGSELVKVSEEIYKEYYKMARRERYMENDIKIGRIDVNEESGVTTFIPSKEDSIDRLMEHGTDFTDDKTIEDIICDKVMLIILQEAMVELNPKEQDFIKNVYYKKLTVREIAKNENVSHVAIVKRNKKVLNKLRKLLNKSGYQTTPLIG
ncbi:MAG TPA: sigma factor-like helix-turn-helix DNA-binding protein [Clostridium sp.]|uniref:sigma factor-like helix-turn-helix DNA-binding protein n=1 Tax=Clostridium sp. TaxID=1506 RepID=UPI002F958CDE